jgi:peptidoglycan hydrolase CwlO-like protein
MGLMGQPKGTSARIVVDGLEGVVGLLERMDSHDKAISTLQSQVVELATVLSALNSSLKELMGGVAKEEPVKKASPKKAAPKQIAAKKEPAKKEPAKKPVPSKKSSSKKKK